MNRKSVCIFCASSDHLSPVYKETAKKLASEMALRGMTLVYGGGNNGLMGVISETIHSGGGQIIGVIPKRLKDLGYQYEYTDEIIITDGMRERKAIMEERADGFIGLPGGFGTFEEILEIITLKQLEMLDKPVVFLNCNNYFKGILEQFERGFSEKFIPQSDRSLFFVTDSFVEALDYIENYGIER